MIALRSNAFVLFVRNRLKVAGSFAVKVQLISVTSPEVGLVGTAMVNAHASGAATAARRLFIYVTV
jgi:hypothetical protein